MSAPTHLTQVLLIRAVGPAAGIKQDVCWIDSKLAKKGARVRDLELEAECEGYMSPEDSVWTVAEVYGTRLFEDVDKQHAVWKRWADVLGHGGRA